MLPVQNTDRIEGFLTLVRTLCDWYDSTTYGPATTRLDEAFESLLAFAALSPEFTPADTDRVRAIISG